MRRTAGLAAFAVAAATAAALPLTTATSAQGAPATAPDAIGAALAGLQAHPGAARAADGLGVVGGDLVVHNTANDAWAGVSQTLAAPLTLGTDATVPAVTAKRAVLARNARTSAVRGDDSTESSELVV